jgi:hypothetical protein
MTTIEETPRKHQNSELVVKAGRFLWHYTQMALVMEAGMTIYMRLIIPLLIPFGFFNLRNAHPLFCYWLMVASMTLPMIALMRFYHKSTWRYTLEMTAAMLTPLALFYVLVAINLCPIHILYDFGDPLMFVAMAIFLLVRPAPRANNGQKQLSCG